MMSARPVLLLFNFFVSFAIADDAAAKAAADVKRILVVYENESTLAAAMEVARGLYEGLAQTAPTTYEVYTEYLDTVRFPGRERIDHLAEDLDRKYAGIHLDALAAVGPGALRFLLDNRSQIAPGVPLIFGAVTEDTANKEKLPADVFGVASHFDVAKTVELARRLQPKAKRLVVLTGSDDFDQSWQSTARQALTVDSATLQVDYLTGLSLEAFKQQVHELSSDTILLILTVFRDADGRKFVPRDAAKEIAAASGAPSYAVYSSYLGEAGVLGGYVETFESIGKDMASLCKRGHFG